MENNNMHAIWKKVDTEIEVKSKDELNTIFSSKIQSTINKYRIFLLTDIFVCFGVIVYLTITALNRTEDIFYLLNNFILGLIVTVAFVLSVAGMVRLHHKKTDIPIKHWLKNRIDSLSNELTGRFRDIHLVTIPILAIMLLLSINIYYEERTMADVLTTRENLFALAFGYLAALFVSFYFFRKIRKYQVQQLENLKEIYQQLE